LGTLRLIDPNYSGVTFTPGTLTILGSNVVVATSAVMAAQLSVLSNEAAMSSGGTSLSSGGTSLSSGGTLLSAPGVQPMSSPTLAFQPLRTSSPTSSSPTDEKHDVAADKASEEEVDASEIQGSIKRPKKVN
jgi:hypothetical protein